VLLLLAKATLCGMESYAATQGRMTEFDIFAFFLLAFSSI